MLNENAIKFICLTLKEIFSKEPNVKKIPTPVTIVGDVHGYFEILYLVNYTMFKSFLKLEENLHLLIICF